MKKLLLLSLVSLLVFSCTKKPTESPEQAGKRIITYLNSFDHEKIYENFSDKQKIYVGNLLKDLKSNINKDNKTDLAIFDSLEIPKEDVLKMDEKEFYSVLENSLRNLFISDIKSFKDLLNNVEVEPTIKYKYTSVVKNKKLNGYNVNYDYIIDFGDNKSQIYHQNFFIINEKGQWKISEMHQ